MTIIQRLRDRGYRLTPQRMAIVQAVLESTEHPSAEDIHRQVAVAFPMLSLATVYKTLDVLRNLGEVVELPMGGRARYDGNPQPHMHLICERCDAIIDWNEGPIFPVPEAAIAASGFRPHHYHIEVYGLCSHCQAEGRDHADDGKNP